MRFVRVRHEYRLRTAEKNMNDGIRMWHLQVVVHVCHVRSIAKRLDERLLRFGYPPLLAENAPQVAVSCKQEIARFILHIL